MDQYTNVKDFLHAVIRENNTGAFDKRLGPKRSAGFENTLPPNADPNDYELVSFEHTVVRRKKQQQI